MDNLRVEDEQKVVEICEKHKEKIGNMVCIDLKYDQNRYLCKKCELEGHERHHYVNELKNSDIQKIMDPKGDEYIRLQELISRMKGLEQKQPEKMFQGFKSQLTKKMKEIKSKMGTQLDKFQESYLKKVQGKYKEMKKLICMLQRKEYELKMGEVVDIQLVQVELKRSIEKKNQWQMKQLMECVERINNYDRCKFWGYYNEGYKVVQVEKLKDYIELEQERLCGELEGMIGQVSKMVEEQQLGLERVNWLRELDDRYEYLRYKLQDSYEYQQNSGLQQKLKDIGQYQYDDNNGDNNSGGRQIKRGRKKGLYTFKNHNEYLYYDGEWDDKHMQGHGRIYYKSGELFEGWIENNQKQRGRRIEDDKIYTGGYIDDQQAGYGKIEWFQGDRYEGMFKNGCKEGQGQYWFNDGSVYQGDYKADKREGVGKYVWNEGDVYEGEWADDKQHGQGKYVWKSGNWYQGQWSQDQQHGQGKYMWKTGNWYDGQWSYDQKHGDGVMHFVTGEIFKGVWKNDKKSGQGVLTPQGVPIHQTYEDGQLIDQQVSEQQTQ